MWAILSLVSCMAVVVHGASFGTLFNVRRDLYALAGQPVNIRIGEHILRVQRDSSKIASVRVDDDEYEIASVDVETRAVSLPHTWEPPAILDNTTTAASVGWISHHADKEAFSQIEVGFFDLDKTFFPTDKSGYGEMDPRSPFYLAEFQKNINAERYLKKNFGVHIYPSTGNNLMLLAGKFSRYDSAAETYLTIRDMEMKKGMESQRWTEGDADKEEEDEEGRARFKKLNPAGSVKYEPGSFLNGALIYGERGNKIREEAIPAEVMHRVMSCWDDPVAAGMSLEDIPQFPEHQQGTGMWTEDSFAKFRKDNIGLGAFTATDMYVVENDRWNFDIGFRWAYTGFTGVAQYVMKPASESGEGIFPLEPNELPFYDKPETEILAREKMKGNPLNPAKIPSSAESAKQELSPGKRMSPFRFLSLSALPKNDMEGKEKILDFAVLYEKPTEENGPPGSTKDRYDQWGKFLQGFTNKCLRGTSTAGLFIKDMTELVKLKHGTGGCDKVNEMHLVKSRVSKGDGMVAAIKDLNKHRTPEKQLTGRNAMVAGDATNDEELFGYEQRAGERDDDEEQHVRAERFHLPGVRALMPWAEADVLWQVANFRGTCADLIERVIWAKTETNLGENPKRKNLVDSYNETIVNPKTIRSRLAVSVEQEKDLLVSVAKKDAEKDEKTKIIEKMQTILSRSEDTIREGKTTAARAIFNPEQRQASLQTAGPEGVVLDAPVDP